MDITKLAITAAVLFAGYKFAPNALVKGGIVSVAAVMIAKKLPYINEQLA